MSERSPYSGKSAIGLLLLDWYDHNSRALPWRAKNCPSNPYHVLLSEFMLQQTTVAAVIPYFEEFIRRWPRLQDFASAREEDVLEAWAGLGYYSRARNLWRTAQMLMAQYGGALPAEEEELLRLPGIGAYTAAAISAIAYGRPAVVVDGNVERVMSRLHSVEEPFPKAKAVVREFAAFHTPQDRAGDYAQAVMDLGAQICTPRSPKCLLCPLQDICKAHLQGCESRFPVKAPKTIKPLRTGVVFWVENGGRVLLVRRPSKGLLASMLALPSGPWEEGFSEENWSSFQPAGFTGMLIPGLVRHVFTHFRLDLYVVKGAAPYNPALGQWVDVMKVREAGLPTVMKKAVELAIGYD